MKNADTRVQFSKKAFKTALLKILQKKPIAKVTVSELCDEAGLNRGTFYLHYREPNDVLREVEDEFVNELFSTFSPYVQDRKHNTAQLGIMFKSMLVNRDHTLILMGPNGAPQFLERFKSLFRESVLDDWANDNPNCTREDLGLVFDFVFRGSTELILDWLRDANGLSTAQLAHRLDRLGHYAQCAAREF